MEIQFDTRTLCYIGLIGLLVSIIACLCCGLLGIIMCFCCNKDNLPCFLNRKHKDDCVDSSRLLQGCTPFYFPQNCVPAMDDDSDQVYGCVSAAGSSHTGGGGRSFKKGKVNL